MSLWFIESAEEPLASRNAPSSSAVSGAGAVAWDSGPLRNGLSPPGCCLLGGPQQLAARFPDSVSEHVVTVSVPSSSPDSSHSLSEREVGLAQLLRWDRIQAWGLELVISQFLLFEFSPLCPSGISEVAL